MINLEGRKDADRYILDELRRAGIEPVPENNNHRSVPSNYKGVLHASPGDLTFRRAWYYWVVDGFIPLEVAKKIYLHPEGKAHVRVDGHCGCIDPKDHKDYIRTYHIDSQAGLLLFVMTVLGRW